MQRACSCSGRRRRQRHREPRDISAASAKKKLGATRPPTWRTMTGRGRSRIRSIPRGSSRSARPGFKSAEVTAEDIAEVVLKATGIPVSSADERRSVQRLLIVDKQLPAAVWSAMTNRSKAVARAVLRLRAARDPRKSPRPASSSSGRLRSADASSRARWPRRMFAAITSGSGSTEASFRKRHTGLATGPVRLLVRRVRLAGQLTSRAAVFLTLFSSSTRSRKLTADRLQHPAANPHYCVSPITRAHGRLQRARS